MSLTYNCAKNEHLEKDLQAYNLEVERLASKLDEVMKREKSEYASKPANAGSNRKRRASVLEYGNV